MSGILCLKWNNHTSTFLKTLDNLRSKELYCDATIACSGRYFPVHRFVLTTCSEYFEGIFERTHCKHPFVIIKDIEEFHLEALLNYMYNGEVNVLQDRLPGLIRAAEALRIRGLAICEDSNGNSNTPEGKKSHKEKKKSDHSSPSLPKTKKIGDKSSVVKKLDVDSNGNVGNNDDENVELLKSNSDREKEQPSSPSPIRNDSRDVEEFILAEGQSQRNETNAAMDVDDKGGRNVKLEPSQIFEAIDEDFPLQSSSNTKDASSLGQDKEGSLFVSLLSPNNTHSDDEQSNADHDQSSNHAIPQCSTWGDVAVGANSNDQEDDEIDDKSNWLESEDFEQLMDPFTSPKNNESSENNEPESSLTAKNNECPSEASTDIDPSNNSESLNNDFQISELSNLIEKSSAGEILSSFSTKIKEEALDSFSILGLSNISSPIDALSKFDLPESTLNYANIFSEDVSVESGESSAVSEAAKKAEKTTSGSLKYICSVCSFKCKDTSALRLHIMRRHTGEKPFSCSLCSYRCTTRDLLKVHTRKHTGERPFSCPYCPVRMSVKSSLKRHIILKHIEGNKKERSAQKESSSGTPPPSDASSNKAFRTKNFICSQCSYKSHSKNNLQLHVMRIHTGERPVACVICPYRTTTKSQLQKHMRKHTGERPFACSFCPYRAAQKHCLIRHMAQHTR